MSTTASPALALPRRGVAAHRAGAAAAPENTLAAVAAALRAGAHQIELDLRRAADGAIVVLHDARVDRTTDGAGALADLALSDLRRLDAGSHFSLSHAGERVPTLTEVLAAVPANRWLNLQIKRGEAIGGEVALALVRAKRLGSAFLACDAAAARAAREVHPEVLLCDLARQRTRAGYIAHAAKAGARFIQFHHLRGLPTRDEVEAAHAAGLSVNFFCAADTDVAALFAAGVDFPLVDDVEAALALAARHGISPLAARGPASL